MANCYKKNLFRSDPCLFDLKKTAKDIILIKLYISIILFLKDSYLALKIDFVNLPFPSGLGRSVAQLGRAPVLGTGCRVFKSPRSDHFFFLPTSIQALGQVHPVHSVSFKLLPN